ncbi:hypothetical protein CEB3_c50380 [Peptococcaceae bacterium CEB3]|nr:hypothetical protein CEB3_c50380 [Peptococcaceae bacterium CEB3]
MLDNKTHKKRLLTQLNERLKSRERIKSRTINCYKVAHSTVNKGFLNGESIERVIFFLRSKGCEWSTTEAGGCFMCGHYFGTTTGNPLPKGAFYIQFMQEYRKYDFSKYPMLCIYNAGSILNENEIPQEDLYQILKEINDNKNIKSIVLESRPAYITDETLDLIQSVIKDQVVEIGIGLESMNETIRDLCINKGFTFKEYEEAIYKIKRYGNIKALKYLSIKPLFLTIQESIEDTLSTLEKLNGLTDIVSLEPVSVQSGTLVEFLFTNGIYQPPKGWIIKELFIELTKRNINLPFEVRIGGFEFFPIPEKFISNCPNCDKKLYKAIDLYNSTKDPSGILTLSCQCYGDFKSLVSVENEHIAKIDLEERISYLISELLLPVRTKLTS